MSGRSGVFSPIDAVTALVESAVTVAHVVAGPLVAIDPDERCDDAAGELRAQDFDVAPVAGTPITHFVTLQDVESCPAASIMEVAQLIPASVCVEISLPLSLLFRRLGDREYVFVLEDGEVKHIVTRADLQAPAIGVVVLSYLTIIEAGLRRLIVPRLGDALLDHLSEERRSIIEALHRKKLSSNVATGYEDCLYFSDWLALAVHSDIPSALGYRSRRAFKDDTGSFTDTRNRLSHGGTILDGASSSAKALERVERIRTFAETVWSHVDGMAPEWDRYLGATVRMPRGGRALAGPPPLAELPGPGAHHVITAYNPHGLRRSRAENRRANLELRDVLLRRSRRPVMVVGESPDGRWREELYLVGGLRRSDATALGLRFGQDSILELDEEKVSVVRCSDGRVVRVSDRATTAISGD